MSWGRTSYGATQIVAVARAMQSVPEVGAVGGRVPLLTVRLLHSSDLRSISRCVAAASERFGGAEEELHEDGVHDLGGADVGAVTGIRKDL